MNSDPGKSVVLDIVNGLPSGYGITADKLFTSHSVAKELLKQKKNSHWHNESEPKFCSCRISNK